MSKAIAGAAELGAAVAMGAIAMIDPAVLANPLYLKAMAMLVMQGVATEAGAIAAAIGTQQGIGITTRQAAGHRQIIYGVQRVGGTAIYESTSGAGGGTGNYVYNYVIPIATHEIDAVQKLFLDGREVYWKQTVNPQGFRANMGQGSVSNPPATTVAISGGAITGITASGGSGFANVKPVDGYRVIIRGKGTGAQAYATNSGSVASPVWAVHIVNGGTGYDSSTTAEIQGAFTFGGTGAADEQDPTQSGYGLGYGIGPGGPHYNFSGKVYAEVRWGDQPAGDIMSSLTWNDSAWTPPSGQNLTGQGVAYLYINVGYDSSLFPQPPEIRLTVNGKNRIYDPRTGQYGFSANWALQVADVLADTDYGVGEGPVSGWPTDAIDQLIAAANVCDEQVMTSQGYESNFAQHIHFDTSTPPGEMLAQMMPTAAGRISHIGPSWYIWPAYWQGPSFSFDESALVDTPQWSPTRSFRDLVNRVNGTYTPPNYPYNVAGNLYDRNGWYYGTTANNWPLEWQPTNYPQYACDVRHGYASDIYLADDGGVQLPLELSLKGCISIVQAQRVAKIHLLRNRQQGSGSFPMFLAAMQMQPLDVMQFSFSAMGWAGKYLEVGQFQFALGTARGQNGEEVPTLTTVIPVVETDPSVYEWSDGEELTPYDVAALPGARPYQPAAPTGVTLVDDTTTAVLQADGTVMPRMLVSWTPPADTYVNNGGSIQVQWQDYFAIFRGGAWIDVGTFSGQAANCYIDSVSSVETVNVRLRSLWADGTPGAWVEVSNWTPVRLQPVLPIRPIGGGGVALQFSSGLTLDQIQPVEVGADQTSNHFAVTSGSFPSATTTVSTSWVTLATITVQVSGPGDTLILFTAQGGAASEMTGFRIQVDGAGSYGYGGFFGSTGVASITGLSAGTRTLTLQGIDGDSPVSVPANSCFVLIQQLTASGGGFKTAPLTTGGVLLTPASIS